jgi:hypothetical protein
MAWDVGTNPAAEYQLTLSQPRSLPLHVAEATVWLALGATCILGTGDARAQPGSTLDGVGATAGSAADISQSIETEPLGHAQTLRQPACVSRDPFGLAQMSTKWHEADPLPRRHDVSF